MKRLALLTFASIFVLIVQSQHVFNTGSVQFNDGTGGSSK